jgi:hypothetical protein
MAAGLGFKTFNTGDVLSAADTNGYLMQGVLVFASAAARDSAITSPQEGQFAYLKDTNVTTYYTGSAWANLDTTGMTNPMTTTGDTIYSSSGSTPARLGIGTTGQVLTVAGGVPSWATPAGGGGKVLQVVQATYSTETSTSSTSYTATGLTVNITPSSATSKVLVLASQQYCVIGNNSSSYLGGISLFRDSTNILERKSDSHGGLNNAISNGPQVMGVSDLTYLDSPATTSTIAYNTKMIFQTGNIMRVQHTNSTSSIVCLEIGA